MKSLGPRLGLHHSYSFSREANGRRATEIRKLLVLKESSLQGGYVDIHCTRLPLYNMFIDNH